VNILTDLNSVRWTFMVACCWIGHAKPCITAPPLLYVSLRLYRWRH
jgi:hypothetical protein